MMDFLHKHRRPVPGVAIFYSDMSYGTRQSHVAISKMALETASALGQVSECISSLIVGGTEVLKDLKASDLLFSTDDERKHVSNYQDAEARLIDVLNDLIEKENSAICDPGLFGNNECTVTDAYRNCIDQLKRLIDIAQDIRWEIMSRVEGGDEVIGSYDTPEELIASMK